MGGGDVRSDGHRRHDRRAFGAVLRQRNPEGFGIAQRAGHREPNRMPESFAVAERDAFQDPIAIAREEPYPVSAQEPKSVTGHQRDSVAGHDPDSDPDPAGESLRLAG
jgi:hypothetical protein